MNSKKQTHVLNIPLTLQQTFTNTKIIIIHGDKKKHSQRLTKQKRVGQRVREKQNKNKKKQEQHCARTLKLVCSDAGAMNSIQVQ